MTLKSLYAGVALVTVAGAAHAANIKNVNWWAVLFFCAVTLIAMLATLIYILFRRGVPMRTKLLWASGLVIVDAVTLFTVGNAASLHDVNPELPFVYVLLIAPGTLLAFAFRNQSNKLESA